MLSRRKNQIMCMHFDSGHGNYMISAQFISQAHFPEKKFRLRLSICNYMPQQIIYPQVPKRSYLTFKRFRVDYSDDVGHSITNFTRLVYLSVGMTMN